MQQLNYDALSQSVSFRERFVAVEGVLIAIGMIFSVVSGVFTVGSLVLHPGSNAFIVFGVICAILVLLTIVGYINAASRVRIKKFALQNHMQYSSSVSYDGRSGIIFGQGHAKQFDDLLIATNLEFVELGNFRYTVGSGKNQQTYDYGFVRIKLPRRLPNMVLDSRANNFFGGRLSNLQADFSSDQKLSLEGNFDKYFTLYAPEKYKTDALYVFTPDVMQALIDAARSYDCEVIDDDFYIYSDHKFVFTDPAMYEEVRSVARALKPELVQQTDYYADERVGDRSLNIVADDGRRLKTSAPIWLFIVVAVVFAVYFIGMIVQLLFS